MRQWWQCISSEGWGGDASGDNKYTTTGTICQPLEHRYPTNHVAENAHPDVVDEVESNGYVAVGGGRVTPRPPCSGGAVSTRSR